MRLTFLISSMDCGGAERVMATVVNHFARTGHQVTLITFDNGKAPPFFPIDATVTRMPLGLFQSSSGAWQGLHNNLARIKALRRTIRESRPDVVISFLVAVNVLVVLARAGLGVPVIVSERDDPWHPTDTPLWRALRNLTYPWADRIVVHTDHSKAYFPKRLHSKVHVIPNPLMVPTDLKPKSSYDPTNTVISVGRLTRQKGFDVLIEAFADIRKRHPNYTLLILGEGPERPFLERLIAKLDLETSVNLKGNIQNVFEILRNSDIFVLASRFEGFGNVVTEAMACGLPIVSTKTSGAEFILEEGRAGILVPIEDKTALSAAIERLIQDPEQRATWGKRALASVARLNEKTVLQMWERLITDVKS